MTDLNEKLDSVIANEVAENEQIKQFIVSNKGKNIEVEVYGLKLEVPPALPKKVRHELVKSQRSIDSEEDLVRSEQDTYYILSLLCQNYPWNVKEAWEILDDETSMAMDILEELVGKAYKSEQKVKSFRGK